MILIENIDALFDSSITSLSLFETIALYKNQRNHRDSSRLQIIRLAKSERCEFSDLKLKTVGFFFFFLK